MRTTSSILKKPHTAGLDQTESSHNHLAATSPISKIWRKLRRDTTKNLTKSKPQFWKFILYPAICALGIIICSFLFFFPSNPKLSPIPITLSPTGRPLVSTIIEGKELFLHLHLGTRAIICLNESVMSSLKEKQRCGSVPWADGQGTVHKSLTFLIPKITLGDLVLEDAIAEQAAGPDEWTGNLGRALLERSNFLFDFQNLLLFPCDSKSHLRRAGYQLDKMIRIPFQITALGPTIPVETDFGVFQMSFNTSAIPTYIRSSQLPKNALSQNTEESHCCTTKTVVGKNDFGSQVLFSYDLCPSLDLDGFFGMNFLQNRVIYIDYQNRDIYISEIRDDSSVITGKNRP